MTDSSPATAAGDTETAKDESDVPLFLRNMEIEFARRQAAGTLNTSVGNCPVQPTLVDINRARYAAEDARRAKEAAEAKAERARVAEAMTNPDFAACREELRAAYEDTEGVPFFIYGARRWKAEDDFARKFWAFRKFVRKEAERLEYESCLRIMDAR
eukprot:jgi/Mesvir1/13605/Mv05134-RA.1